MQKHFGKEYGVQKSSISGIRGGSRTAATSKMEHFVIIVNGWKPLIIITKSSIVDVAAVLDPPLEMQDGLTKQKRRCHLKNGIQSKSLRMMLKES